MEEPITNTMAAVMEAAPLPGDSPMKRNPQARGPPPRGPRKITPAPVVDLTRMFSTKIWMSIYNVF